MPISPSAQAGANIRAEMARRGVSQVELSTQLDLSQSQLSKRLRGDVPLDVDELVKIAEALDVPLSVLLPAGQAAVS